MANTQRSSTLMPESPARDADGREQSRMSEASQNPAPVATTGEKMFHRATYWGINGVGVFVVSCVFGYFGAHGKDTNWIRKGFKASAEWLQKRGLSADNAWKVTMTTALMMGGNLLVVPVWVNEHYKKPIVRWLNKHFGTAEEAQSGDLNVLSQPRQTVWSLGVGRVAAWLSVFTSMWAIDAVLGKSKVHLDKGRFQVAEEWVAEKACKLFRQPVVVQAATNTTPAQYSKTFKIAKIAAVDSWATAAATTLLFWVSKFSAVFLESSEEKQSRLQHMAEQRDVNIVAKSDADAPAKADMEPETERKQAVRGVMPTTSHAARTVRTPSTMEFAV